MKTNKPANSTSQPTRVPQKPTAAINDINSIPLASIEPDSETAAFIAQIEAKRDYYHTCINGGYWWTLSFNLSLKLKLNATTNTLALMEDTDEPSRSISR